ncbi:helix-turn-helix domain-containing protein [Streptomyces sp. TRM68367]|nr:helix-turn-helix domain-containing protein [Streptomyces sp. TRM68367]
MLSEQDRLTLRSWSRSRSIRAGYVERARIVLACAQPGAGTSSVAAAVGSTRPTVIKWRERFRARASSWPARPTPLPVAATPRKAGSAPSTPPSPTAPARSSPAPGTRRRERAARSTPRTQHGRLAVDPGRLLGEMAYMHPCVVQDLGAYASTICPARVHQRFVPQADSYTIMGI